MNSRETLARPWALSAAVVITLAIIHSVLTWGYVGWPFGDYGVWLHQVERYAVGETPYSDFVWTFPPMSLWVIGGAASFLGTDLNAIWGITVSVYMLIAAAFCAYLVQLAPTRGSALAAAVIFVAAIPFSSIQSASLPLGMYTPAASVGMLFLLALAATSVKAYQNPKPSSAAICGVLFGCCFLTKQDFWLPALVLLAGVLYAALRGERPRTAAAAGAGALGTLLIGGYALSAQAGISAIPKIFGGYGFVRTLGVGRMLPTWESVVTECVTASVFCGAVCLSLAAANVARRKALRGAFVSIASAMVFTAVYWIASRLSGESWPRAAFADSITQHAFSIFLPEIAAIVLAWRWKELASDRRRGMLAMLVMTLIAARARRGFERVETFQVLLELPVYLLLLEVLLGAGARRAMLIVAPVLVAWGCYSYWLFESGPLTRSGIKPQVLTMRGPVRTDPDVNYELVKSALDSLDPSGRIPVVSFGSNGGYAYFLRRTNPLPTTFGIVQSGLSPEMIVASLKALPQGFLAVFPHLDGDSVPDPRLSVRTWLQPRRLHPYLELDLPYFVKATKACLTTKTIDRFRHPYYRILDCRQ